MSVRPHILESIANRILLLWSWPTARSDVGQARTRALLIRKRSTVASFQSPSSPRRNTHQARVHQDQMLRVGRVMRLRP